jgi:hypothetical protein
MSIDSAFNQDHPKKKKPVPINPPTREFIAEERWIPTHFYRPGPWTYVRVFPLPVNQHLLSRAGNLQREGKTGRQRADLDRNYPVAAQGRDHDHDWLDRPIDDRDRRREPPVFIVGMGRWKILDKVHQLRRIIHSTSLIWKIY